MPTEQIHNFRSAAKQLALMAQRGPRISRRCLGGALRFYGCVLRDPVIVVVALPGKNGPSCMFSANSNEKEANILARSPCTELLFVVQSRWSMAVGTCNVQCLPLTTDTRPQSNVLVALLALLFASPRQEQTPHHR